MDVSEAPTREGCLLDGMWLQLDLKILQHTPLDIDRSLHSFSSALDSTGRAPLSPKDVTDSSQRQSK